MKHTETFVAADQIKQIPKNPLKLCPDVTSATFQHTMGLRSIEREVCLGSYHVYLPLTCKPYLFSASQNLAIQRKQGAVPSYIKQMFLECIMLVTVGN